MTTVNVHNVKNIGISRVNHGNFEVIKIRGVDVDGYVHETTYYVDDIGDVKIDIEEGALDDNSEK